VLLAPDLTKLRDPVFFFAKDSSMPTNVHSNPAPISYRQAQRSYFIHDGQVHSVAAAPASIFKAAIEQAMDTKRLVVLSGALQDIKDVLSGPDDLFSRWWLLCHCGLRFTAKPMTLFGSKEDAVQALGSSL
jgi:hypothetical protein